MAPEGPARRDNDARLRGPGPEDLSTGAIELDEIRRGTAGPEPTQRSAERSRGPEVSHSGLPVPDSQLDPSRDVRALAREGLSALGAAPSFPDCEENLSSGLA